MEYPVAYLITFSTYGTWLHGDNRGSVDRQHNCFGDDFVPVNLGLSRKDQNALKSAPFTLDRRQRETVLGAVLKVCVYRGWFAHAVHVRNNHVHVVVSASEKPEKMMVNFKAYATRLLRKPRTGPNKIRKYWTQHGSTRCLWTKESLASAIKYVRYEQGNLMAFGATETDRAPNVSEG